MTLFSCDRISARSLGRISDSPADPIKFILLDDGLLLFGKAQWHKDLMRAHLAERGAPRDVVAAGTVPSDIAARGLDDEDWGGWKSTGFGVRTPIEYRAAIREALLPFAGEIAGLSD